MNAFFSEHNLKLLNEAKIYRLGHLFKADEYILSQILKKDISAIQALKQSLHQAVQIPQINAYSTNPLKCFRSGIVGLDELLDLIPGKIYEFCGLSATGKTQICNSIAINLAERGCEIFYITKTDFSGQRILNILLARSYEDAKIAKIMRLIKMEKVFRAEQLIETLNYILDNRKEHPRLKLLIIDSLQTFFYLFHGEQSNYSLGLLAKTANLLARLANEQEMVVITVNIVGLGSSSSVGRMTLTPALGKYWKSIPTVRILMTSIRTDPEITNEKQLKIIKSENYKTGLTALIKITNQGVI